MKKLIFGTVVVSLLAVTAHAQTTTPTTPAPTVPGPTNTMPSAKSTPDANAPLSGANSFTESQARARIEQLGYSKVTGLAKDSEGVWRGTAMKDGRSQNVAVDFRGNIVVGQK